MRAIRKRSAILRLAALLAALLAASTAPALAARGVVAASQPRATKGGTVYLAEQPGVTPSFIFPFMSAATYSVANTAEFQYLMYRPLYSFGQGGQPALDAAESIAQPPVYADGNRSVTVTLKAYRWSDGEAVTAEDVAFWLNVMKVEKHSWAAYAPGELPDDLASVTVDSPSRLTLALTGPVNPEWFTDNELSQVTPLPLAWDVSASGQRAGSQACAPAAYQAVSLSERAGASSPVSAAARSCAAVYSYLEKEAGYEPGGGRSPNNELGSYATNPLWAVVDGPFELSSFDPSGKAVFVPNRHYSGPVQPSIAQLVEVPYPSSAAEFQALESGQLTVGYLPYDEVTSPAGSPTTPGANNPHLGGYTLAPWYAYGVDYIVLNFDSTADGGVTGRLFGQLYFRQALQLLVDQPAYVRNVYDGYAAPTYGPVPTLPAGAFVPATRKEVYPYDPAGAVALLAAHGWTVHPHGVSVCTAASRCGVPRGSLAAFGLQYVSSGQSGARLVAEEVASFALAGIDVTPVTRTPAGTADAATCRGAGCAWQAADWGGGFLYSPGHYPSGETLFAAGGAANTGSFSSAAVDVQIRQTEFGSAGLSRYDASVAADLPVIWQPAPAYQLTEVEKDLQGVTPQDPYLTLDPEDWYFTKS